VHGLRHLDARVEPLAGGQQVALGQEVALAQLDTGQPEARGQLV